MWRPDLRKEQDMKGETLLIALLRAEICGGPVSEELKAAICPELLAETYELAHKHDLAHICGQALSKLGLLGDDEISHNFKNRAMQALYRYVRMNHEYETVCKTLEKAQIPFIPLKGSVLRANYPEPWMRTSCDVDILVREETLEEAAKVLVDQLQYIRKEKTDHDISMFSPSNMHLELHYTAVDEGRFPEAQEVLKTIWSTSIPKENGSSHYCMTDEMFYFFHIAHMAKHFENGGCGVRPFLDLWILNHRMESDRNKREALLAQGGMLTFARAVERLTEVWFSGLDADPLSAQLERFIFDGGVYGTLTHSVAIRRTKTKSKQKYVFSKIFLPYDKIKYHYPILWEKKWLTPFFQIVRWMKLIFKGGMKRSLRTLQVNETVSSEEVSSTADLLQKIGL